LLEDYDAGLARLADDLADGTWERRYGELLAHDEFDAGYRLVVAARRPVAAGAQRHTTAPHGDR
jgi:hypothetical protein